MKLHSSQLSTGMNMMNGTGTNPASMDSAVRVPSSIKGILYEIVNEARPLSGFPPADADFVAEMRFLS